MDDGLKYGSGFILCINSFQKNEVELLIQALKARFDLDCNIRIKKNNKIGYMVYIRSGSMPKFKELVIPYFYESMKYKLD